MARQAELDVAPVRAWRRHWLRTGAEGERTVAQRLADQPRASRRPTLPMRPGQVERTEFEQVRRLAALSGGEMELGKQGNEGVLRDCASRRAFLSDPGHPVVCHSTPNHSSCMNQIEIRLSILARKVRRRGSFTSVEHLHQCVLAFIDDYNRTAARPFQTTCRGKALVA